MQRPVQIYTNKVREHNGNYFLRNAQPWVYPGYPEWFILVKPSRDYPHGRLVMVWYKRNPSWFGPKWVQVTRQEWHPTDGEITVAQEVRRTWSPGDERRWTQLLGRMRIRDGNRQ